MSQTPLDIAARVVRWQREHGRHDLPWQQTRDPYRVWLSEVMLQQTQVSTVLGYYDRFLQRFSSVQDLAQAPLDDVLALWSGLGYYSRARNLHACAQQVVARHSGQFPQDAATLCTLPGIGRSTAAAIAAFCFGAREAILDGNVKRVLTRVLGFSEDLSQARHEKALWSLAESLLPHKEIGRYTQGLMDLGSQVCLARQPLCTQCPVRRSCVAHAQGRQQDFPVKTKRARRGRRVSVLWWCQHQDPDQDQGHVQGQGQTQVWLVQRPATGVWAGLWCLPEVPVQDSQDWADLADTMSQLLPLAITQAMGSAIQACVQEKLSPVEHALTHFDWLLLPVRATLPPKLRASQRQRVQRAMEAAWLPPACEGRWFRLPEALKLGLPAPVRKLLESA